MDENTAKHLMELYGLSPDILPYAFQFPRLPPRSIHPLFKFTTKNFKEQFSHNRSLNTKLEDFQQLYQKYASGLFDTTFPGLIPPGHPLYSRQTSIETLQLENKKLQKENLELKKHLEQLTKKSTHN